LVFSVMILETRYSIRQTNARYRSTPPACCSIVEKSRTCIDRQVMSPLLRIRMPKPESPRIPPFRELGRTPCRQFNQAPNYADCSAIGEVLCITLSERRVLPKRVTSRYRQHRH
jgi:hypothetical protein